MSLGFLISHDADQLTTSTLATVTVLRDGEDTAPRQCSVIKARTVHFVTYTYIDFYQC